MPLPTGRRRRQPVPRVKVVGVRFSEVEHAEVVEAAAGAGLTPSGFVAGSVLAAARGETGPGNDVVLAAREAIVDLMAVRTQLVRLGTNVNQIARALNSTGEVPDGLEGNLVEISTRLAAALSRNDEATARVARNAARVR